MSLMNSLQKNKINLKYSSVSLVLEALGILALFAVWAVAVTMYPSVGDTVPRSFGPDGTPLEWTVREFSLIFPIFAVFIYVVVTAGCLATRRAAPPDRPCPVLVGILNAIAAAKIFFLIYALIRTRCAMSCVPAPGWLLPLLFVLFALTAVFAVFAIRKRKQHN